LRDVAAKLEAPHRWKRRQRPSLPRTAANVHRGTWSPPVDITFGDFLRAVITSDFDLQPSDKSGLRDAFMQAFRVRGIVPDGASFFSDTAIAWPMARDLPPIPNLEFGDPNGFTPAEQQRVANALRSYFADSEVRRQFVSLGVLDLEDRHSIISSRVPDWRGWRS
jgi:hypothetical protein